MVSRYVTNGPVKQEGICLFPPPAHYRMMPPQRADGYQNQQGGYVSQPNQGGNQAQALRALPPSCPPNQASTPPNADIKVQTLTQQPMFASSAVRAQPYYSPRSATGPPSQPRMPNQHNRQQPLYPGQPVMVPHVYFAAPNVQQQTLYTLQQRPQNITQQSYVYPSQPFTTYPYAQQQTQPPQIPYFYNNQMRSNGPPPQTAAAIPNATQPPIQNIPIAMPTPQHYQRQSNKRRPNALAIIDPSTGEDRLNEMYEPEPTSGESSARQTPQPSPHNPSKEVQAFMKQVAQVAQGISNDDVHSIEESDHHHLHDNATGNNHILESAVYVPNQPHPVQASNRDKEHLAQSSNLKPFAKEFVSSNIAAKETTPIVSANCDSVEVTLPNKQQKDRESPVKSRKQRDHLTRDSQKESASSKDCSDKISSSIITKEDIKQKDVHQQTAVSATNVPAVTSTITITSTVTTTVKDCKDNVVRDDKRSHVKKEVKPEPKVPSVEPSESSANVAAPPASGQPINNAQDNASAKSKQNVPQRLATQKQPASQNNQKTSSTAATPVPPPQPAKANNKSHKKSELNLKGANKEGTDMDAFNDNSVSEDNINANVVPSTNSATVTTPTGTTNDIINANSVSIINNTHQLEATPIIDTNKKTESNETTIKPSIEQPKVLPKGRVDVTAIVKDQPKSFKPILSNVTVAQNDPQDETDRAIVNSEKIVQVKNEVNAKVSSNSENIESKLPYRDGQWTPNNQSGEKVYTKDFLVALRDLPASKKRPDCIPDSLIVDDRPRYPDGRASMGGRTDFISPPFTNYQGKSSSQRGVPTKRGSQSGKISGSVKGNRPQIKISLSLSADNVKLNEVENAWRPARFHVGANMSMDDKKTEELYRKVRGVLNKLTPQKFDTLISQVSNLEIDNAERLQGVIDLVFEKAVDEPNFSEAYALMCKELALMQVPTGNSAEDSKGGHVNFRKLIVTRCQMEFEKQSIDESIRNDKVKEIQECNDPEKKKDLMFELEEYDRKLRMKSVGNIRFIGELFKQKMLTVNIMNQCLTNLLRNKDEENLECLCKLLTTIGKELEMKQDLSNIFNTMKEIVDKKHGKISSRVRFMLQDVIDLRSSNWVPRRQDLNPKTIDQIQKEAEHEQLNNQALNLGPMTPRKDERNMSSGSQTSDRKRKNVQEDGGWVTSSRSRGQQFNFQSDKFKNKVPPVTEPLGSKELYGAWVKGSNMKINQAPVTYSANMYAALDNMETEKRLMGSRPNNKDPYSSKGPSLERNYNQSQSYGGRGSRSGSQHRTNDVTAAPPQNIPQAVQPIVQVPVATKSAPLNPSSAVVVDVTSDQFHRRIRNCLDEYVTELCTAENYESEIKSFVPLEYYPQLVAESYLHILERSSSARIACGDLFAKLIKAGSLSLDDYCAGLNEILSQVDDLIIDIPMFWEYFADILIKPITLEVLTIERLCSIYKPLVSMDSASKLLSHLFKTVVRDKGPSFLENIWRNSGLSLTDFMSNDDANKFVKDNKLEFLSGGDYPVGQSQITYDQIQNKLKEFFNNNTSNDDITKWITVNVGERVKEDKFIRALATAIFEDSIIRNKLVTEKLILHYNLLHKFVDNDPNYELQCLYALQALVNKLEHPQGLLLSICNQLYGDSTFSQESFITWETSTDGAEQGGKGVAIMQLTSFFTQLRENEEDDEYEGSSSSDETQSATMAS